jgi:hypothetical protein
MSSCLRPLRSRYSMAEKSRLSTFKLRANSVLPTSKLGKPYQALGRQLAGQFLPDESFKVRARFLVSRPVSVLDRWSRQRMSVVRT